MQLNVVKAFVTLLFLKTCTGQNLTVPEVCLSTRTKSVFCSNKDPCKAGGIIYCYGNLIGEIIPCSESEKNCVVNTEGDSCSASVPKDCRDSTDQTSGYQCTSFGYFPDLNDCQSYIFCGLPESTSDVEYEVTPQFCPEGNVFDPNSASYCSRRNSVFSNCVEYQCDENIKKLTYVQLSYGSNRQLYALCIPKIPTPRVFVCPNNAQPVLTSFPAKCSYRCLRIGNFENTLDKTKFFECNLNASFRFESVERNCPPRTEFSVSKSRCEITTRSLSEPIDDL